MKNHDDSNKRWIRCSVEQEYLGEDRKSGKVERKLASSKDRSKYKKTDKKKYEQRIEAKQNARLNKENLVQGRVLSIVPQGIIIDHEGRQIICSLKGALKKEKGQMKNLVAVGDFIFFEMTGEGEAIIHHVEPRRTVLSRADNLSRRKEQLIAANIDQVIVTVSVVHPVLKPYLVDRYLIAASKGGMGAVIVINKIDLLDDGSFEASLLEKEKSLYQDFYDAYTAAGLTVIPVSVVTGQGLETLKEAMKDKASVFSGQSGVGKSSLINAITGSDLKIGAIVGKTKKGSHTTTTANLLPLSFGGWCIDTPGIKSFGVWNLEKEEVKEYFDDIFICGRQCKYPDCAHWKEAGCAVHDAVEDGKIPLIRYESYLFLMGSVGEEHVRR